MQIWSLIETFLNLLLENQTRHFGVCYNHNYDLYSNLFLGGIPPYDGYPVIGINQNSIVLVIIYNVAAVQLGLVLPTVCFIFNIIFRKKK